WTNTALPGHFGDRQQEVVIYGGALCVHGVVWTSRCFCSRYAFNPSGFGTVANSPLRARRKNWSIFSGVRYRIPPMFTGSKSQPFATHLSPVDSLFSNLRSHVRKGVSSAGFLSATGLFLFIIIRNDSLHSFAR